MFNEASWKLPIIIFVLGLILIGIGQAMGERKVQNMKRGGNKIERYR